MIKTTWTPVATDNDDVFEETCDVPETNGNELANGVANINIDEPPSTNVKTVTFSL